MAQKDEFSLKRPVNNNGYADYAILILLTFDVKCTIHSPKLRYIYPTKNPNGKHT